MKTTRFLLAAGISLAMAFTFSCSGDSNESPPDQSVSSSSGGGGGKGSSSSGGGSSSSDALSSSLEVSSSCSSLGDLSSSSGGEEPSVSSSSGGDPSSSSLGDLSSSSGGGVSSSSSEAPKCGGIEYDPIDEFCQGTTIKDLCGTATFTASQFCDHRDDKIYKKTTINTQTWMAENLNYNASDSRCYGDDTGGDSQDRCGTYGRLYDWNTAMNNAASSSASPSGVQGVCPSGWHLPSDAEWNALIAFVHSDNGLAVYTSGSSTLAGKYLKAESGWNSYSGIVNDDKYGFSVLPGGNGYSGGNFDDVGSGGGWWSSTQYGSSGAYSRYMYYNYEDVVRGNGGKSGLHSVRCAQD